MDLRAMEEEGDDRWLLASMWGGLSREVMIA